MFRNSSGLNEILTQNVQAKSGLGPKFFQNMFGLSSGFLTYNWGSCSKVQNWFHSHQICHKKPTGKAPWVFCDISDDCDINFALLSLKFKMSIAHSFLLRFPWKKVCWNQNHNSYKINIKNLPKHRVTPYSKALSAQPLWVQCRMIVWLEKRIGLFI